MITVRPALLSRLLVLPLSLLLFLPSSLFANAADKLEITVSAAASLTDAFGEAAAAFMLKHPDVRVLTNFAASTTLLRQMEAGAPVDVLATADMETMNQAAARGLVPNGTQRVFAFNTLVLIRPVAGGVIMAGPSGLLRPEVKRIAIGNPPSVPAGRYAEQSLKVAGLWDKVQDKLIFGENVRQVLDYVARGEAEAGIVYGTDARQAAGKVIPAATLGGHAPILYPIAVTADAAGRPGAGQAAQAFVAYILSDEGRKILEKYGFMPEPMAVAP